MEKHNEQINAAAENLRIFNAARSVPDHAKKRILAGKLKGMTNVSPVWRIEKLTELFGPAGIGWVVEDEKFWVTEGAGEAMVNCTLSLKVRENGLWSLPITGIGGSKLYGKGVGDGLNDEAFKMAETDALSVACKSLGLAADVYYGEDDTKYSEPRQRPLKAQPVPQPSTTLASAIEEAKAAQGEEELKATWAKYRADFGGVSEFKSAIAHNKCNPKNKQQ